MEKKDLRSCRQYCSPCESSLCNDVQEDPQDRWAAFIKVCDGSSLHWPNCIWSNLTYEIDEPRMHSGNVTRKEKNLKVMRCGKQEKSHSLPAASHPNQNLWTDAKLSPPSGSLASQHCSVLQCPQLNSDALCTSPLPPGLLTSTCTWLSEWTFCWCHSLLKILNECSIFSIWLKPTAVALACYLLSPHKHPRVCPGLRPNRSFNMPSAFLPPHFSHTVC